MMSVCRKGEGVKDFSYDTQNNHCIFSLVPWTRGISSQQNQCSKPLRRQVDPAVEGVVGCAVGSGEGQRRRRPGDTA